MVLVVCCVWGLAVSPVVALGEGPSSSGGGSGASPLQGSLVVSGGLEEGQQVQAAEQAMLTSPEAVARREESESKYENLGSEVAEGVINGVDPVLVDQPEGGPPRLPEGERVLGFPTDYAMSVVGSDGSREVREELEPVALEATPGQRVPIDLGLSEVGGSFQPRTGLAPVRIPKRLSDGAALSEAGVSLTPVDERGGTLAGEGVLDGASVFYGDSEAATAGVVDVDTLVKPSTFGLMMETSLRSQRSPSNLFFRVGLVEGGTLEQESPGSGTVRVVQGGKQLAVIFAPAAHDAEGTRVPVSMVVEGDMLVLTVDHPAGAYAYPIIVDPRYEYYASEYTWDKQVNKSGSHATNWHFEHTGSLFTGSEAAQGWTIQVSGSHGEHEQGWMAYTTKGQSHIWDFASQTAQHEKETRVESRAELINKSGIESQTVLTSENTEPVWNSAQYCRMGGSCLVTPETNNSATYVALASGAGTGKAGENVFRAAEVAVQQEGNPEATFDTTDATVNGHPNALYGTKTWLGPITGALVKFTAADKGIGIEGWSTEHTNAAGGWEHLSEKSLLTEGLCSGIQCPAESVEYVGYSSALPDGEPKLGLDAWNAMYDSHVTESEAESLRRHVIKVDSAAPVSLAISGLPAGNEIDAGEYHLKAEATDGSGSTPSSGIKSIELLIDGRQVGQPLGSCEVAKAPCTAHTEFGIAGRNYATGKHVASLIATDNAGNVASGGELTFIVHPASSANLGPGSVNLASGEYNLAATDVSMSGVTVGRSYNSRHLGAASQPGPFGPQWGLSLGGQESLVKQPTGSMVLTNASGAELTFAINTEGKFEAPSGDANLTLVFEEPGGIKQYVLKDAATATSTTFRLPSGGSGEVWTPSIAKGAVATNTVTYSYETLTIEGNQVTRPTEALAPVPANVTCPAKPSELKPGCRALVFKYGTSTTATGESESEWGDYIGRLKEVLFVGYNPATKAMAEVAVAKYEYDKAGRLRAEWDPRVATPLKTLYGYDEEGHVTALTPPGQEPWMFTYGTITGDTSSGRIVKAVRATAATALWNGKRLKSIISPTITGTAVVGNRITTNNASFENSPLTYGYQWYDCTEALECTPIAGATNQSYTIASSDLGYGLEVRLTATNSGGSQMVGSFATKPVTTTFDETKSYTTPEHEPPIALTAGPEGKMWYLEKAYTGIKPPTISSVTTSGTFTEHTLPFEEEPTALAAGPDGNLWYTELNPDKYGKMTPSGVHTTYSIGILNLGVGPITTGSDNNLWFMAKKAIYKSTTAGTRTEYPLSTNSEPGWITSGPDKNLWFTRANNKIGKITTAGVITEYELPAGSGPRGITAGPDENLWFTERSASKIGKITTSGTITTYSLPSGSEPYAIVSGPEGALWFSDIGSGKIGRITTAGVVTEFSLWAGAPHPVEVAAGPDGYLWFTQRESDVISKLTAKIVEGTKPAPTPGLTVEYNVGLSGAGLPTMTETEVAKWGQTDDPTEATAIIPPDEPQSWPASSYKRATIYYLDGKGRTVNVATPSGGISTTEFNETNDAVRSLTPDNRATALGEGAKSAEAAKLLDTESTYNAEGTELLSTLGPQHPVRLVHGKTKENEEVQARNHTVYSYDEGAPAEGGPYRLVTKVTQGAQVNGEDRDVRTTTTSYGGQENLGWKLRAPTSVTANPSGLKLTTTTVYDSTTGKVIETRAPASTGEGNAHDTKTISYTAAANATYPGCGEHPEWATLACETLPGKQPEPALPITTAAYNMWGEPEKTTQTVGTKTRTTTTTYDAAGRPTSTEPTSTEGKTLPKVTDEYNSETGALEKQSATIHSETKTITSKANTLGQLLKYTDAEGTTTEYEYEHEKDDRLTKVNDGKGIQAYSYNETTGELSKVTDTQGSNVLTFTTAADVEGNMTSETYPNGMTASFTQNAAGEGTGVSYEKTTHCTEHCVWFSESVTPSIHAQTLEEISSLETQANTYDEVGRLTQVRETPAGEGCTTRIYEYDAETNREKLTTRAPGAGGICATEGGTSQTHTYDSANRLTDTGTTYDTFGDTTKLPATDAGGTELQSSYFVDGQLAEQKQGAQTIGYEPDPNGRALETVDTGTVSSTYVTHYAGAGDTPAWTVEPLSGQWTRYVSGPAGLAAIETGTTEPELALTNLQGSVVAKASLSETATKLLSSERSSEYGVPTTAKPAKYSWLGGNLIPTELPSGVVAMGARSYVPQVGRFLQPDPMAGGSANAYAYTNGNPVNETDLTGNYVENNYLAGIFATQNQEAIEIEAAREAAARAEAERKAQEAAWQAAAAAKMAAELAEAEARNAWDAEAAAGPPGAIPGGGMAAETPAWAGYPGPARFENLMDCAGGCHVTPQQEKCLKKAGNSKSKAGKCFSGQHGNWKELVEVVKEAVGIIKCAVEVYKGDPCPNP
jgi:RHS repeat-associated protein